MATRDRLEFVNRGRELAFLEHCILQPAPPAPLIVVRSPPGFGKSRLTDELGGCAKLQHLCFCAVDPSVRSKAGTARLYDGFFLQRCAEALSSLAETASTGWPTLGDHLRSRRWTTAREKKATDAIAEMPSFRHAYKVGFEYFSRLFAFGEFSPGRLLASDNAHSVDICSEYTLKILKEYPVLLIVREAQHCDLESLRNLLRVGEVGRYPGLIFEYTTTDGEFEPTHQKLFLGAADARGSISILDLVRLDPKHLETLIRSSVESEFSLSSDFYLAWNGNLRSIVELKYRVGIGRQLAGVGEIGGVLSNLNRSLGEHIAELSAIERLILAVIVSHVEAIDRQTLLHVIGSLEPRSTPNTVETAIAALIERHGFLSASDGQYRVQNDTISSALLDSPGITPLFYLSEKALRDHYARILDGSTVEGIGLSTAVRQLFRLAAKTKDALTLVKAREILASEVAQSNDQSIYVDIVSSAVEADPDLYRGDADDLIQWAACLAYEVSEWRRCVRVLGRLGTQSVFSLAMRACALQEIGGHDDALALANDIEQSASSPDEVLVAQLVRAIITACRGDQENARELLESLVQNPAYQNTPLLGYAHRFYEATDDYGDALKHLNASITWFDRFDLAKSRAYSQLPAAVLTARLGDVAGGRTLIDAAEQTLRGQVRDQYIILNNMAAVELLSNSPNYQGCINMLTTALRLAKDDYTELTILTNLALAYGGATQHDEAVDCVEKTIRILECHDFADADTYWPVCFNGSQVLIASGFQERGRELLRLPATQGRPVSVNRQYWAFRYGEATAVDPSLEFLASKLMHPLYLSHWTIDLDGLNSLRQAPTQ